MVNRPITLDPGTSDTELRRLASDPDLILDISYLDACRLPPHVDATLFTRNDSITFPALISCRDLIAEHAKRFSAPHLEGARSIDLYSATEIYLPKLKTCGDIDARNVRHFEMQELVESGSINAKRAKRIHAPHLESVSGDLYAPEATIVHLPKLSHVSGERRTGQTALGHENATKPSILPRFLRMLVSNRLARTPDL